MSVRQAILSFGPSSYWQLNETSGTDVVDMMGAVTGTYVNTPSLQQPSLVPGDPTGKAVLFDNAIPEAINFGNVYNFTGTENFTALAWIKNRVWNNASGHNIWANRDITNAQGWSLEVANPAVTYQVRRGDNVAFDVLQHTVTEAEYESGQVRMVAIVYNGSTLVLNIDGVQVASMGSTLSLVAPTTTVDLWFGAFSGGGSGWDGTADDLAIFPTALTEAQIRQIYESGDRVPHFPTSSGVRR